jgi:hypothetical protein
VSPEPAQNNKYVKQNNKYVKLNNKCVKQNKETERKKGGTGDAWKRLPSAAAKPFAWRAAMHFVLRR